MREMTLLHARYSVLWRCLGAICLLVVATGCNPSTSPSTAPLEYSQDLRSPRFERHGDGWALKLEAANLGFRGLGAEQRAVLQSPTLIVGDGHGQTFLQLKAEMAIALHPYSEISWHTFSLQNIDATTFEGSDLLWPYLGDRDRVALLGQTLVLLPQVIVEADTLSGDLLLRGYEIKHVRSVTPIEASEADSLIHPTDD